MRTDAQLGASNLSSTTRQELDFYATHPDGTKGLLELETFSPCVLEPSAGNGHIVEVLREAGYIVKSADIIQRDFPLDYVENFLERTEPFHGDIITNPPYGLVLPFIKKSLELIPEGGKVALLLRTLCLEGKERGKFFEENPPIRIWVSSKRLNCPINGDFKKQNATVLSLSWFIWEKGFKGKPTLGWFNK